MSKRTTSRISPYLARPQCRSRSALWIAASGISAFCIVTLSGCGGGAEPAEDNNASTLSSAASQGGETPTGVVVSAETSANNSASSTAGTSASEDGGRTSGAASSAPDGFNTRGWGRIQAGMTSAEITSLGYTQTTPSKSSPTSKCSQSTITLPGGNLYATYSDEDGSNSLLGVSNRNNGPISASSTDKGLKTSDPISRVSELYPGGKEVGTQIGMIYVVNDPSDPDYGMSISSNEAWVGEIRDGTKEFVQHFESCINFG